MAALTWKNIDAPDLRGVGLLTEQAGRSLNAGFDNFTNIIKERNKVEDANWNQGKENNIAALRSLVQGARTADEYNALMQSGKVDELSKKFGAQIDQKAAFDLIDNRLATLQGKDKAAIDYRKAILEEQSAPIIGDIMTEANSGNIYNAQQKLGKLDPTVRGKVAADIANIEQRDRRDAQGNLSFQQKLEADRRAAELGNIQIQREKANYSDEAENRNLQTLLSRAQQAHLDEVKGRQVQVGKIAIGMGLPVDSTGAPRIDDMTSLQRAKFFNKLIVDENIADPESYLRGGDTKAADRFIGSLGGVISPHILAKNRDSIRGAFDSSLGAGTVGRDRAAVELADARTRVAMEEQARNNWNTPNSPDANRNHDEILKLIPDHVPESDRESVTRALYEASTKGIKAKDGNLYVPSMNEMLNAIKSTNDKFFSTEGWSWGGFGWNDPVNRSYGEKVLKLLGERMKEEDATKRLANAEEYKAWQRKDNVKKILSPAK